MKKIASNLIVLSEIDSTNNYAKQLIQQGEAEHFTVVLAHCQSKGRGQATNRWVSEPYSNILTSIILYPTFLPAEMQFYLSKTISVAITGFLSEQTEASPIKIKWPNDIYIGNRKIAGILIENYVMGSELAYSVIGAGININQVDFPAELPNPVSLKQLTGKEYQPEKLLHMFLEHFDYWYNKLQRQETGDLDKAYQDRLFRFNEWTFFRTDEKQFEGRIIGTDQFGRLLVSDRSNNISKYMLKEIEFVI